MSIVKWLNKPEYIHITKYNSAISSEEKVLNDIYFQLGKVYYENSGNPDANYESYFNAISSSIAKIDEMKKIVQALKSIVPCPNCGAEMRKEAIFCNLCGTEMPKTQFNTVQPVSGRICTTCGNMVPDGVNFCTTCGTPMQQAQPQMTFIQCPVCNTNCPSDAAFCVSCGNKISG